MKSWHFDLLISFLLAASSVVASLAGRGNLVLYEAVTPCNIAQPDEYDPDIGGMYSVNVCTRQEDRPRVLKLLKYLKRHSEGHTAVAAAEFGVFVRAAYFVPLDEFLLNPTLHDRYDDVMECVTETREEKRVKRSKCVSATYKDRDFVRRTRRFCGLDACAIYAVVDIFDGVT